MEDVKSKLDIGDVQRGGKAAPEVKAGAVLEYHDEKVLIRKIDRQYAISLSKN